MKNIHRINTNVLLRLFNNYQIFEYYILDGEINITEPHYIKVDSDINNVVWDSGNHKEYINKIYSLLPYYEIDGSETIEEKNSIFFDVLINNIDWSNIFGLHCIIKDSVTNEVLISQMLKSTDFSPLEDFELISGQYWIEGLTLNIPKTDNILLVDIYPIQISEITNEGLITTYTSNLTPLINEKPIPDYIQTNLILNNNHFLRIETKTTENKTLEKSILDYFGQELANINLTHLISYGTIELGFKEIRVKNETNQYLPIIIGLDLSEFSTETNDLITIFVKTEINVDDKLMVRETILNTTLLEIINPLVSEKITHPETNYPVNVTTENIIQNTIIETKTEEKIIEILIPIFVNIITEDILFENKNISFSNLISPAYLIINENEIDKYQSIKTKTTSDNKYYFDLNELKIPKNNTPYVIRDIQSFKIIGEGFIITE